MVAHPVTQVTGELAAVDILNPSKVAWTGWGCLYSSSGLRLRMHGEGFRPIAGAGNKREEQKQVLSLCMISSTGGVSAV